MTLEIPEVVVNRLPVYARALAELAEAGESVVSSQALGERLDVTPAQIRKDLSYFGRFGKQGRGYNVNVLLTKLREILGLDRQWRVCVVGVGRLGKAVVEYGGFEPQGFLDAWGPVFFFAMIFAISMDYTVFLLSSAKEHWDRSRDAREAMVGGVAHSGRTIFAAAAVMVAVFFTFALSGPIPPKEMGVILGVAVLLDAMLIRLVLMPVLLRVLGERAWALPHWLDRVLPDVRFGHS